MLKYSVDERTVTVVTDDANAELTDLQDEIHEHWAGTDAMETFDRWNAETYTVGVDFSFASDSEVREFTEMLDGLTYG